MEGVATERWSSNVVWLRSLLQLGEWLLVFVITVLAGARSANPSEYEEPARAILLFLQARSFTYVFFCGLGIFCLKILNEFMLGRYATNYEHISSVLNSLHKKYFFDVPEEEMYQHRVTVFKAKRRFSFRPNYLCVFGRSGTTFQKSKTRWKIDNEHEEKNEGVAGRAWFTNATVTVTDLPQWPETVRSTDISTRTQYAQNGLIPLSKATLLNVKSRSVTGTVVRTVSGRKWGVLVLDSRDPHGISDSREKKELVELSAAIMTHMV